MAASKHDKWRHKPAGVSHTAVVGSHVEVELIEASGSRERLAFDIVPDSQADFGTGFLGASTPLAQAVLGQCAGSSVPYQAEDIREVHILTVAPSHRIARDDIAANRQAVIQRAVSKSDLENAVRFALTVDVKWGNTDPEGIADHWE
jgi:hypothetical protein